MLSRYTPLTAAPYRCNETYMEWKPCQKLQPYIRCFWGSPQPYRQNAPDALGLPEPEIVTPDTCVDIIFHIDYNSGRIEGNFFGIDDRTFVLKPAASDNRLVSTFAIRFYAWTAILFSEESMSGSKNQYYELGYHFSKLRQAIEPLLFDVNHMEERVRLAERYLLNHLHTERASSLFMDAVAQLLASRGNIRIGTLCREIHASSRQLERLFQEQAGISPKQLASLIRYQYLWRDILCNPHFQVLDAVQQYGYTDQAHLARDFKRFHSLNIPQARAYAKKTV